MLRRARGLCVSLALMTGGLASGAARADLIDPSVAACGAEGTRCEVDGAVGTCQAATCSRLVYGGDPEPRREPGEEQVPEPPSNVPRSESYECVKCVIGAAPSAPEAAAKGGEAAAKGGEAAAKSGEAAAKSGKTSGCAVGSSATSWTSVGLGLVVVGLVARRRRR